MKRVLILFTLLIVVSHGCTERSIHNTLIDIESFIQERPDSALAILDTIDRTTLTTQKSRAHHALLSAMALDKNFVDVPITWFEINSEQIGMEEGTMTTYICYYAFIIPEDKIYVIEE